MGTTQVYKGLLCIDKGCVGNHGMPSIILANRQGRMEKGVFYAAPLEILFSLSHLICEGDVN